MAKSPLAHNSSRLAWVIPAILGCGLLTWLSFLYPGIRMRNRTWLIIAGVSALLTAVWLVFVFMAFDNPIGVVVYLLNFVGGIITFFVLSPRWIRWRPASQLAPFPAVPDPIVTPSAPVTIASATATDQWITPEHSAAEAATSSSMQTVRVNTATAEDLLALGDLSELQAQIIVHERSTHGPFADLPDFLARSSLPPHIAARVRDRVVFTSDPSTPPRGRVVDL